MKNIFEELQDRKQNLAILTEKAVDFGWISVERKNEILKKIENDTLTIGVIGQMKCGKSTFINSFVFEDDILPAATTPMTAALSVITYGPDKKIVAEFYTNDEWEEQKIQASRSLEEVQGNTLEESKVKAAKELVAKSFSLGSRLNQLLGKTQEDQLENLIDYVGADGEYVSIVKSVTIYYPTEYLKGVEIVDTPGFNDPIVSREERTKSFLKKADVVLMMLYAGRPFDSTDRDILFKNVRQCGTGKVLIGINKYDIPYENGETEEDIKKYVKKEIEKACTICDDDSLVEILKNADPIPLSAEMALLSELPMSKITNSDAFQFAWKRVCNNFEISNQMQMREKSHIDNLSLAVKQMIETEKSKILFAKPLNSILAAGNSKKSNIDKSLRECESLIRNLKAPDEELEEKEDRLNRAERRLNKKIDALDNDLEYEFTKIIREGKEALEDKTVDKCKEMNCIIDDSGWLVSNKNIDTKLKEVCVDLVRDLERIVEQIDEKAKRKVMNCVNEFFCDAEDILMKNLSDFDSMYPIKSIRKKIGKEMENDDLLSLSSSDNKNGSGLIDYFTPFLLSSWWVVLGPPAMILSHSYKKKELHNRVISLKSDFKPKPYLEKIRDQKVYIINEVKQELLNELVNPLQDQIKEVRSMKGNKEASLNDAKNKLDSLQSDKKKIVRELEEINMFV